MTKFKITYKIGHITKTVTLGSYQDVKNKRTIGATVLFIKLVT